MFALINLFKRIFQLKLMEKYQENFVRILAKSGALRFDRGLKLNDGRDTPYFLDIGKTLIGHWMKEIGDAYAIMIHEKIENDGLEVNTLYGPSYEGIPVSILTATSLENYGMDVSCVFDRKEEKMHGEKGIFVGDFPKNANIYIVDDVLTSAQTKINALEKIVSYAEKNGRDDISVTGVGIAFDREQVNPEGNNPFEEFRDKTGILIDSIVCAKEAIDFLNSSRYPLMINGKMEKMPLNIYHDFLDYMSQEGLK